MSNANIAQENYTEAPMQYTKTTQNFVEELGTWTLRIQSNKSSIRFSSTHRASKIMKLICYRSAI